MDFLNEHRPIILALVVIAITLYPVFLYRFFRKMRAGLGARLNRRKLVRNG